MFKAPQVLDDKKRDRVYRQPWQPSAQAPDITEGTTKQIPKSNGFAQGMAWFEQC